MPRKKRIWYPGALYHISSRGNHKGEIFREEEDYLRYLTLLKITLTRHSFVLYSYCLMTNHVHLQIETKEDKIWDIMHCLHLQYTKYFNQKYNLVGHLFQGRYHAEIIENDAYALQTSSYIHLNPVRAKIVNNPIEYRWSSYDVYIGKRECGLVNEEKILSSLFNNSREMYKEYVEKQMKVPGTVAETTQ